jgi:hypothetical protein
VIHDFSANPGTGSKPNSALIEIDASGYLYGHSHGSNAPGGDPGTLFRIKTDGSEFALLHVFEAGLSGNTPMRGLVHFDGAFYGVTAFGGLTTDVSSPETGPGFIFRYEPLDITSSARTEYIDWLISNGLLVNQSPEANTDDDRLSLIEEFTFGGDPALSDHGPPLSFSMQSSPVARLLKVRSSMTSHVEALGSEDLTTWLADTEHSLTITDHPVDGPDFKELSYSWPEDTVDSAPWFIRFNILPPEAVEPSEPNLPDSLSIRSTQPTARARQSRVTR